MGRAYSTNGDKRNAYRLDRKTPLGRPRNKWVDNIMIDLRYDGVVQTGLHWLRTETGAGL
jgi:hypothetical protein